MLDSAGSSVPESDDVKKARIERLKPHQFKPGQSGNPSGKPPLPPAMIQARKHNQKKVAELLNSLVNMTDAELEKAAGSDSPQLEQMVGAAFKKAKQGEYSALNFILDRLIGRVTEKIEHSLPKPTMIKLRGEDAVLVLDHKHDNEDDDSES